MSGTLVVNADDLGVSEGANLGILRAHREGIVTSASLAVTTPHYAHALETVVRACPDLAIGLHFTLTSGRPVSPASRVPLLVGPDGFFRWRFTTLLAACASGIPGGLLEQIAIELDAQLGRLEADGVRVDHVDGERHVHLIPGIFETVAAAAARRRVPFVRLGRDIGRSRAAAGDRAMLLLSGGFVKSWLLSRLTERARRRLEGAARSADFVASYLYTGRVDRLLAPLLQAPPPPGILEVMVHPGVPAESRGAALGNAELERYLVSPDRRAELDACVAARGLVGGWTLTTFARLAAEGKTEIVPLGAEHVEQVTRLHLSALTGLLADLGEAAVRAFYDGALRSGAGIGFVEARGGVVRGFVFGSLRPDLVKGAAASRNAGATAAGLLLGVLRDPEALVWLLRSFAGPDAGAYDPREPELTYLAVSEEARKGGVGTRLVDAFASAVAAAGARSFALSVDETNAGAAAFYEAAGFRPAGSYREFGRLHRRYRREPPISAPAK